jgi:LmbE family N-acetylglucosaminyl deacetylase
VQCVLRSADRERPDDAVLHIIPDLYLNHDHARLWQAVQEASLQRPIRQISFPQPGSPVPPRDEDGGYCNTGPEDEYRRAVGPGPVPGRAK